MKEKVIKKISELLEKTSLDLASQAGCLLLWGETELPDEIREEANRKER